MMYEPQTMLLGSLEQLRIGEPSRKIGVLGGTFNPVHNGHIDIGIHVRSEFGLSHILYIVAGDPPHKEASHLAPAKDRFRMVELATMERPGLWASDVELRREGHTYTVDTMRILQAENPDAEFQFIIGEDTLFQLETWRDFAHLCRMMEFICVLRPGKYDRSAQDQIRRLGERFDAVIHLSEYTGSEDISSTDIRERVRNQENITGYVPAAVEEYIYGAGLYL